MKRYKLLKDLPTFKAGEEFFVDEGGNLIVGTPEKPKKIFVGGSDFNIPYEVDLVVYGRETLKKFPNILTDWFEEIKFEIPDEFEMGFWHINYNIEDGFFIGYLASDEFEEDYEKILKHHMEVGLAFETEEEAEQLIKKITRKNGKYIWELKNNKMHSLRF